MSGDVCQNGLCHFGSRLWTVGPSKFHSFRSRFSPLRLRVMSSFAPAAAVDDVLASSLETVESLAVPRDEGDSDPDWEKPQDDVAVARATLAHNLAAHVDETVNSTLTSFTAVEVDDTTFSERLQAMDAAMARLMMKGDEQVVVTAQADVVMEDQTAAANSTVPAAGDLVPEARQIGHSGDTPDDAMGVGSTTSRVSRRTSGALASDLLTWPCSSPRWSWGSFSPISRPSPGQGPLWNVSCKVEGKCKLCQQRVIAVDKGPPSAEIKLGSSTWRMFCGPNGVSWHTDA